MSRADTELQNAINAVKPFNMDINNSKDGRKYWGQKRIQTEFHLEPLLDKRYGMYPIGYISTIGLVLTGREATMFLLILDETYNAGYVEWHMSAKLIERVAKKYNLFGLKDIRSVISILEALHSADLIHYAKRVGKYHSTISIHRGTFIVENFERVEAFRTAYDGKRNINPKKGIVASSQEILLDLGCNTFANSATLFDFSDENNSGCGAVDNGYLPPDNTDLSDNSGCGAVDNSSNPDCMGSSEESKSITKNISKSIQDIKELGSGETEWYELYEKLSNDLETKSKEKPTKENFRLQVNILIDALKLKTTRKSKLKPSEKLYDAYELVQDKEHIESNYLKHLESEGKYAKTLANFLISYEEITEDMKQPSTKKKPSALDRAV